MPVYGSESEFFNDEKQDGKRIYANSLTVFEPERSDSSFLVFYLLSTDKDYYTYHQSLNKYSGGEDPFTETSPVYSNVSGGLGIFAAYTIDSITLRIK
jgi:uncharacterized protein (DUF1919 family)